MLSALGDLLGAAFLDSWDDTSARSSQASASLGFNVNVAFPFFGAFSTASVGMLCVWIGVLTVMQRLEKTAWPFSSASLQVFDAVGIVTVTDDYPVTGLWREAHFSSFLTKSWPRKARLIPSGAVLMARWRVVTRIVF